MTSTTKPAIQLQPQLPDFIEFLADLDRTMTAMPDEAAESAAHDIGLVIAELHHRKTQLLVRMCRVHMVDQRTTTTRQDDRLLTVDKAAEILNVKPKWLYSRSKSLPFARKLGGNLRFSEAGLRRWMET